MPASQPMPMTYEEASAKVAATATHPRVTKELIEQRIADVRFLKDGITTICIIEMQSGFKVIGHSTPAAPENYQQDVGEGFAYANAFRQLWPLEGYLLKNALWEGEAITTLLARKSEPYDEH